MGQKMSQAYYRAGTFFPSTNTDLLASISSMIWVLFIALNVFFGIAGAALWTNYCGSQAKHQNRKVGYRRDEIQIDPADVPQFKPNWQNSR
jgi:hypothetical protein